MGVTGRAQIAKMKSAMAEGGVNGKLRFCDGADMPFAVNALSGSAWLYE